MDARQRALAKYHSAVVLSILALLAVYVAFIWFVWGELAAIVLETYGLENVWAILATAILFLLLVEAFVRISLGIPRRVARYVAEREGLV